MTEYLLPADARVSSIGLFIPQTSLLSKAVRKSEVGLPTSDFFSATDAPPSQRKVINDERRAEREREREREEEEEEEGEYNDPVRNDDDKRHQGRKNRSISGQFQTRIVTHTRARGDPSRDRRREGKRERTRAGKSITIVENICRGPERGGPSEGALERERKGTHAFRGAHDDDEETVGGRRGRIRGRAVYAEESRDAAARLIGFSGSHDAPCRRSARRQEES